MSQRTTVSYAFAEEERQTLKQKMLNWLRPFSIFAYLDNNGYTHEPCRYELLVAAGAQCTFAELPEDNEDWLFGHFTYDYKNAIEPGLHSRKPQQFDFADTQFFRPQIVAYISAGGDRLVVSCTGNAQDILEAILASDANIAMPEISGPVPWNHFFSEEDYLQAVTQIRHHIEEGDCYELNLCTGAHATLHNLDAVASFHKLNSLNPSPFAALYRNNDSWLLCASPERFVYREGSELRSQPIKGTARRSADKAEDEALKSALLQDPKERAENVMIVDLVRNDLAKSCVPGTIAVPELFGLYSFPQVHQLISTVTGQLKEGMTNRDIIRNAFPMGSMTGAPKVMVMKLIERYERNRRGLYSGTVGYITPDQNFDFNVVIRSVLYHAGTGYLSYQTGGAITYDSIAEQEWLEVRLKARAMEQLFS